MPMTMQDPMGAPGGLSAGLGIGPEPPMMGAQPPMGPEMGAAPMGAEQPDPQFLMALGAAMIRGLEEVMGGMAQGGGTPMGPGPAGPPMM